MHTFWPQAIKYYIKMYTFWHQTIKCQVKMHTIWPQAIKYHVKNAYILEAYWLPTDDIPMQP